MGRRWNIDPVVKPGQSTYSCLSNNPIIMVDPNGDDDYYNENGVYLYTDTKVSTDIRIITQAKYEAIQKNYSQQMSDKMSSYPDLINRLEQESKKVTIKITGEQFKSMLKDSNLNSNRVWKGHKIRRKEQAALIVLDVKKYEIRLVRQEDRNNTFENSKIINTSPYPNEEGNRLFWDAKTHKNNDDLIIIAAAHTHPINGKNDVLFKDSSYLLTPEWHGNDNKRTQEIGGANYQIYPPSINQVDKAYRFSFGTDNFMKTTDLLKNPEKLVKDAMKTFGTDPMRKQNQKKQNHEN